MVKVIIRKDMEEVIIRRDMEDMEDMVVKDMDMEAKDTGTDEAAVDDTRPPITDVDVVVDASAVDIISIYSTPTIIVCIIAKQ
mmetsp:Transcript_55768/g.60345  ORF Transcript_55768/g.60345 Transcript_55768/m.60345 type:complete len:83 (+) Transcript_55768:511-759(+)